MVNKLYKYYYYCTKIYENNINAQILAYLPDFHNRNINAVHSSAFATSFTNQPLYNKANES